MTLLSAELLTEIVSLSSQGMLVVDASGPEITIVYANPAYAALSGYAVTELEGSDWLARAAADDDATDLIRLRHCLACDEPVEQLLPFLRKDGDIWLSRCRLSPLASAGDGRRLWLVQQPLAEAAGDSANPELLKRALGQARRKLASLDRTDPVTGLMARGHFDMLLKHQLALARRDGRTACLLLFSVPELDVYRQTFGESAADSALRMIGAQITGTFRRASDLCARVGASRLAVAALNQTDDQARRLIGMVEQKTRNLGLHNPRGKLGRHVVVRGTWLQIDPASDDIDDLIARATQTLRDNTATVETPTLAGPA